VKQRSVAKQQKLSKVLAMLKKLLEKAEGEVIAKYLPAQLTADEIKTIIAEAIASTGAAGPADMGKVMGAIKPKIAGKADGALVSSLVKESLNK